MSQEINNREYRKQAIKELLAQMHAGKPLEEVKKAFQTAFTGVSAAELGEAEQALIAEGLPVQEIENLCNVHAAAVGESIRAIHTPEAAAPGHPAHTLKAENRAIEQVIARLRANMEKVQAAQQPLAVLLPDVALLGQINIHYLRKENLFFPYLESQGVTAPPKVMWGVHDSIRTGLKQAEQLLREENTNALALLEPTLTAIQDMIYKEETILLPMLQDLLTPSDWDKIARESGEIGYCLLNAPQAQITPAININAGAATQVSADDTSAAGGQTIPFPTGNLTPEELGNILNTLPLDITFVGADNRVRYFSQNAERVFPRTKAIIGRNVANCHPPASVQVVEGIINDFKAGKKSHEDFWLPIGDKFVFIRYYAVRNEAGEYLGVLEVTQDIAPLQKITGEKRLVGN